MKIKAEIWWIERLSSSSESWKFSMISMNIYQSSYLLNLTRKDFHHLLNPFHDHNLHNLYHQENLHCLWYLRILYRIFHYLISFHHLRFLYHSRYIHYFFVLWQVIKIVVIYLIALIWDLRRIEKDLRRVKREIEEDLIMIEGKLII